jgi:5-methylcytosine-specific restriction endonuclease McrA
LRCYYRHRTHHVEIRRRWEARNPEKARERFRRSYCRDPEKRRLATRRWAAANRERANARVRRYRRRKRANGSESYDDSAIFERDGWICQICGGPVDRTVPRSDRAGATIDHAVPLSAGGLDAPSNVRLAHRACNASRGNRAGQAASSLQHKAPLRALGGHHS